MPDPFQAVEFEEMPSVASGPFDTSGRSELAAGTRWHDFVIVAPLSAAGAHTYLADHIGLMEKVVLRARPIDEATEWRRGAWEQLSLLPDSKTVRCIEAHEEAGWRYEVTAVPPAMTLREWLAAHRPTGHDIAALMRQLAATLGALHAQGVVHLNLRPESIHIDETAREPIFLVGGLQHATLYTQPKLTTLAVDPLYAPPEAMELELHRPGTRLCAWDWWSVGRLVQELLLGQHVLGLILERDVSRLTLEVRTAAESLLREADPKGQRAGALDYVSPDAATGVLLRGLLTSSCEARWGLDEVQRWLRRETVRDHYDLPRSARMWHWRNRAFTLAEAAEHFTQAAQWEDGENVLFHQEDKDSLAFFLHTAPAHHADAERLQQVCELTETPAWGEVPTFVRRTAAAALAWLSLAVGNGARVPFRLRGQTIDSLGLAELLKLPDGEGVALVSALLSPALIEALEPLDPPAARALKALEAGGGATVRLALRQGWLDPHDDEGRGKILALALQRTAGLRERVALLRDAYATNRDPALAQILANREPTTAELILLTFTGDAPERYGYVTHADWRRERRADLEAQAGRIVVALFWLRLQRLLRLARGWALPWPVFLGASLAVVGVVAWLARSAEPAVGVAAALFLPRAWLWLRLRSLVGRVDPAARPWSWRDGFDRCAREATRGLTSLCLAPPEIAAERRRLREEIAKLATPPVARRTVAVPQLWDVALVMAAGSVLALTLLAQVALAARGRLRPTVPPAILGVTTAVSPPAAPMPAAPRAIEPPVADTANDPERLLATGRYEVLDDGFGRRLRGPLRLWNFESPAEVAPLAVQARAPASPEQTAFALVSGNLLVQPYVRKSVNVMLAVRVPTTRGIGLLFFNARDRRLIDHDVWLVTTPLTEQTWYQAGSLRVLFLGVPTALEAELSPAEP